MTAPLLLGMGTFAEQPGGLNRYVGALVEALRAGGCPVRLVTVPPGRALPLRLVASARQARRWAPVTDVVDAHFALYAWWPVTVGALRRTPLVAHVHGAWASESSADPRAVRAVKRRLERVVYARATRLVVLSETVRDLLVGDYGVDPARVVVLAPGVDRDRFSPGPSERAALGLPTDRPVVLAVRRLVPRTGVDVLVAASGHLPGAHLAVVGDGPERGRLQEQAEQAGIAGRVTFAGRVSDGDLPRWYRSADVVAVPSVAHENWGLTVDEALACGTPVVASRLGGLPAALAALPADCLVPPGNAGALADRLRTGLDGTLPLPEPDRCRATTAGREWSAVAARTRTQYDEVTRPRVTVVGHCARPSGAELALLALAPSLADLVELTVVLGEDGPVAERLRAAGVAVDLLPLLPAQAARRRRAAALGLPLVEGAGVGVAVARLAALLRRRRTSLVHAWTLPAGLVAAPAARLAGAPLVWSARDLLGPQELHPATARVVRATADRLAAAVVANSTATLESWRPRRPATAVVASPGVVADAVPRRPGGPFTVGCLSRLSPWKGQDLAVRAFALAFPAGPQRLRLVGGAWFGEDDWAEQLRALAASLGVADRVELVGHRDDVAAELAALDVVVACSTRPEPFGQVVVEALTGGRPVVVTAEGGPAETVTDGVDGLVVPPRDPGALAAALRRLHDDTALRARLADAGRATAGRFAAPALAAELAAVYRSVLP